MYYFKILSMILVLFVISVPSCTFNKMKKNNASEWAQNIVGTYEGEIWSSGELVPVTTTFSLSDQGLLTGTYRISGDDSMVQGSLMEFRETAPNSLECTWQDPFGKGKLKLTFSGDYKKFDGLWLYEKNENDEHPWNGEKLEP